MDHLVHESAYRGEKSVSKRSGKNLVILGCGAVGSWLIDLLVRQGYTKLTIVDFDKIERSNFGTQNYGLKDIGRLKASQCSANVYIRLGIKIESVDTKITDKNIKSIIKNADLVIDAFDNLDSREIVRQFCHSNKINCLHAGVGTMGYLDICWNERYKTNAPVSRGKDLPPCDVPIASNLVFLCSVFAAEIVNRFIDNGEKIDLDFWLKTLKSTEKKGL